MKTSRSLLWWLWALALATGLVLAQQDPPDDEEPAASPPAVQPTTPDALPAVPAPNVVPPPNAPQLSKPATAAPGSAITVPQFPPPPAFRQIPNRPNATSGPPSAPTLPRPQFNAPAARAPQIPAPGTAPAAQPAPGAAPAGNAPGGAPPIAPTTTDLSGISSDGTLAAGVLNLQMANLEQVLTLYANLTGRTVLRATSLPKVDVMLVNQTPWTKEEAVQALDAVLTMNGISMVNVGEKFVSAVPSNTVLQEGGAFTKANAADLPETGQLVTKIVKVKYGVPSEIAQVLTSFSKVPNGILPLDTTQSLVIRDYPANMKRMLEMIAEVDVEVENDYRLEVIPIKYGQVGEIYETMGALIGGGGGGGAAGGAVARTTGTSRTNSRSTRSNSTRNSGMGGYGGYGGTGGYGGYNSGYNRGGYYPQQAAVTPVQPGATATRTTPAANFNQRFQQILNRAGQQAGQVQLLQDAKIVPDERSNSLIVFAGKQDMKMLTNLVAKVDRLLAQVLVEAVIMDVSLSDDYSLGVSMLMHPQQTGDLTSVAASRNGQSFLSSLTNFVDGTGSPGGGFSYLGRLNNDLDVAVQALAADNKGQILARPRIQTSHARSAYFDVGQSVPYVQSTYTGGNFYGPSSTFTQLDVSSVLEVTPFVTPDGLVVMDISQSIQEISGYEEFAGVGRLPKTIHRDAQAYVSVRDRETIILGGYIRSSTTKSSSGVPLLKDIPGLGALFRNKTSNQARTEMLVLIRPTVLNTPEEAAAEAELQRQRMSGINDLERDLERMDDSTSEKLNTLFGK